MRRLTKREKSIFILCVLTGSVYFVTNGVVKPLKKSSANIEQKISSQKRRLRKQLKTIKKAKQLQRKHDEFLSQFKQDKSNDQVMSSIVSEIEQVANDLELPISELKPQRVKFSDQINHFSVSVVIDSSLVDIVHFLYILQNNPHLFSIEEARFDKSSKRKNSSLKTRLVLSKILIL